MARSGARRPEGKRPSAADRPGRTGAEQPRDVVKVVYELPDGRYLISYCREGHGDA
jgi:hypothetical protein